MHAVTILKYAPLLSLCVLIEACCSVAPTTITQQGGPKPHVAGQPALHVVGVYQGAVTESAEKQPWWAICAPASGGVEPPAQPATKPCIPSLATAPGQRTVVVNLTDDSAPVILGLMAYDTVTWDIRTAPGVVISKVILAGYHQQKIQGTGEALVDVYSVENSPCERCVQHGRFFYAYDRVPYEMELAAGVKASSFQGNYTGGIYNIFKGMSD